MVQEATEESDESEVVVEARRVLDTAENALRC